MAIFLLGCVGRVVVMVFGVYLAIGRLLLDRVDWVGALIWCGRLGACWFRFVVW